MKLVRVPETDSLLAEVKKRFADFHRSRPPAKGRRYPVDLRHLVCNAAAVGIKLSELSRLTGLSVTGLSRWVPKASTAPAAAPRRLEVVAADEAVSSIPALPIVVRLPSGIIIELADGRALTTGLLAALSAPEVRHAAAR